MKKRLRKKLRVGEFAVPVIPIAFRMRELDTPVRNELLDRFIKEAIEANGLQFGGGGGSEWSGCAEPVKWPGGSITSEQRAAVQSWLEAERDITRWFVGEVTTDPDDALSKLDDA